MLLSDKFYTSHDGEGHVIRMIEFDKAIKDVQIPVRLAQRINHGLSYPYFNFNYPFIYYASFLLHKLSFDFVTVFKIIMFASVFMGGASMYLFSRYYFDEFSSFVASVFYIIVPYRFLNMYVRGTVAESFALGLLPFLFFSIEYLVRKRNMWPFVAVVSLMLLSHNITALFAIPLSVLYFIIRTRKEKKKPIVYKTIVIGLSLSLSLTAFFWLPAIAENGLTKLADLTQDYRDFFPSIKDIIYSPWGFGAFKQGDEEGKMSPQIGIVHSLISLVAFITLFVRVKSNKGFEKKDSFLLTFLLLSLICFFLMFPTSLFLWDHSYYLKLVQHPWRLVGYVVFGASIGAGYVISNFSQNKIKILVALLLLGLLIYANRNHIRVNQYVVFQDPFEKSSVYGPSTTSKDEHMPKFAPRIFQDPNPDGDVFPPEKGMSKRLVWKSNYHLFTVDAKSAIDFRDNTSYFPGWKAFIDGKESEIQYKTDGLWRLRVHIPEGLHKVEFFFGETNYRLAADLTSLITATALFVLGFIYVLKKAVRR